MMVVFLCRLDGSAASASLRGGYPELYERRLTPGQQKCLRISNADGAAKTQGDGAAASGAVGTTAGATGASPAGFAGGFGSGAGTGMTVCANAASMRSMISAASSSCM